MRLLTAVVCTALAVSATAAPKDKTVEQLAKELKPSIVVVMAKGRETAKDTLGTGYIVSADGVIATNYHVIGERRHLVVETADGKKFDVVSVEATDRGRDLATIRIDAKGLPALKLGDSDTLSDGQPVVALGNPHGLKHSVVAGVVSGRRDIDGTSMIQLAIPLEPGNSGGPVVDMQGKVRGTVTLKSLVTENLGYASPVNALKPLLEKPNPVAMSAWVTIGALDPDEWKPAMGATWRQRAGTIKVQGQGTGFGGRSLCIHQPKPPALPYELAVTVKLDDEKGAAGLLFHHDGERHYGFYPTGGKVRLTRFEGPDVFSWKILEDLPTRHYRPGEWNTLKVRVAKEGVKCFVNGELVIDSKDDTWAEGQPGLCKFRDTAAEFKHFRIASKIDVVTPPVELVTELLKPFDKLTARLPDEAIGKLAKQAGSGSVLRDKARDLERQATRLKELAAEVHQVRTYEVIAAELAKPEDKIDLARVALLVAKLDNEELDVDGYRAEVDRMGAKLAASLPKKADDAAKLKALNTFFFDQRGFHGSRNDYYAKSNSYLNEVIDDREGLPITLSILYMEMGHRIGLKLAGVGLPGHFVVRQLTAKNDGPFIDVYEKGEQFSLDEARKRVEAREIPFGEELVAPATKKQIATRMLQNLLGVAREEGDMDAGLRYLDGIVMLDPEANEQRFLRAVVRFSKGRKTEALQDVNLLVDRLPPGAALKRAQDMKRAIERELGD